MHEEADKREHSTKPERDDLTNYQSLNSLGGAGVRGEAKEAPAADNAGEGSASGRAEAATSSSDEAATGIKYDGDYNDGADFTVVDNKGRTNA